MVVIGLAGKKRAGKDTFCEGIIEALKGKKVVKRIALADALKDEVYESVLKPNGIDRSALDDERKECFRLILQGWGTDFKRKLIKDRYWLDKLEEKLNQLIKEGFDGVVVVTDIRFQNEGNFILEKDHKWTGYMVRINRPKKGFINKIKDLFSKKDKHPSEVDMDDYHCYHSIIKNDKEIKDLYASAKTFVKDYGIDTSK